MSVADEKRAASSLSRLGKAKILPLDDAKPAVFRG
jgi:hypothetical protein